MSNMAGLLAAFSEHLIQPKECSFSMFNFSKAMNIDCSLPFEVCRACIWWKRRVSSNVQWYNLNKVICLSQLDWIRFTRELLVQSLEIFHKWRTTNDLAAKSELRIKGPWYQQLSSGFCSLRLTWLRIKCIWEETGKATKCFRGYRKFVKAAATTTKKPIQLKLWNFAYILAYHEPARCPQCA